MQSCSDSVMIKAVPAKMVGARSLLKVSVCYDGIMHEPQPRGHKVGNDHIYGVVPPGHHQHHHP